MGDGCYYNEEHVKAITELQGQMKVMLEFVTTLKDTHSAILRNAVSQERLALAVEHQGEILTTVVQDLKEVREIMSTKDSMARVHDRQDEFEGMIDTMKEQIRIIEQRPAQEALETNKEVLKAIRNTAVGLGTALILLALGVIWVMIKNGTV